MKAESTISRARSWFLARRVGYSPSGLLVRHLVLPNRLAGTEEIMHFLTLEVSTNTYLNIMTQYYPCYKTFDIPLLSHPVLREEFYEAIGLAHQQDLDRLDKHDFPFPLRLILR